MSLKIMSVGFALIPNHSFDSKTFKAAHGSLEKVCGLIWMTCVLSVPGRQVLRRSFPRPCLYEIVVKPVLEDFWHIEFQCFAVYPRFRRGSSDGIANESYGNLEAVAEHVSEPESDSGKIRS